MSVFLLVSFKNKYSPEPKIQCATESGKTSMSENNTSTFSAFSPLLKSSRISKVLIPHSKEVPSTSDCARKTESVPKEINSDNIEVRENLNSHLEFEKKAIKKAIKTGMNPDLAFVTIETTRSKNKK